MKRLFFDVETTGLSSSKHAIHQIAGIIDIDGEVKETFNFNVKPFEGAEFNEKALECSNTTIEQIQGYEEAKAIHTKLIEILSKYANKFNPLDTFTLIGFNNITFDNKFLRAFFEQNNDKCFDDWFFASDDVIQMAKKHFSKESGNTLESYKLVSVVKALGIEVEEDKLHDALYDIELTRQAYYILKSRLY